MNRFWIAVMLALVLGMPLVPPRAVASGHWLDGPLTAWHEAGMAVPAAPSPGDEIDASAWSHARAPETAEDEALVAAGWYLHAPFQSGWGVRVMEAVSGFDSLGQPLQYQAFVFVDGAFAGTLSPDTMQGGADGTLDRAIIVSGDTILAQFRRYTGAEPIDSPSGMTSVNYQVERGESGPVVIPLGAQTVALASPPGTVLSLAGPNVLMEIDEDEVRAGEKFTISIEARSDDGVARIVWFATDTDDRELQQPRTADCDGAGVCRYTWPVVTTDTTGRIMIRAAASDVLGRASPAVVQELRVREASTAPELTLDISEAKVTAGQQFTIQLDAASADGIDKLTWWATGTDDVDLQRVRAYDCGGAASCRTSWPVTTTDTTGKVTIIASASDVNGRKTEDVVQELKVGKSTSKPTVELKISRTKVSAGERFKIEVYAKSGQPLDKIWWYATDTTDRELKRDHELKCDGTETCRGTWQVETTDTSGTISIVAKARDKTGRESDRATQQLRIAR